MIGIASNRHTCEMKKKKLDDKICDITVKPKPHDNCETYKAEVQVHLKEIRFTVRKTYVNTKMTKYGMEIQL